MSIITLPRTNQKTTTNKKIIIMKILLLLTALSLYSCTKPNEPEEENLQPGRRDYVWTVDTLKHPNSFQTHMRSIWAANATDVYVVGFNDSYRRIMYHYDGKTWAPVKLTWPEGGTLTANTSGLSSIYGSSSNNIWAVGDQYFMINPNPP